jgi:predicted dehydrogenase
VTSPRDFPRRKLNDTPWGIGIVGGGDISGRYASCIKASPRLVLRGLSAKDEDTRALVVDPIIDIVVNLTPPLAHEAVSRLALQAGKHVYSEKPLAHDLTQARSLMKLASQRGLVLACAPATFLGNAQQSVRQLLDAEALGTIIGARGILMYPGPDKWHHNPAPLFGPAAGPLFDMGIYHLAALAALFGPIESVTAFASQSANSRIVAKGPKAGERFSVSVPTHVCTLLKFVNGQIADLVFSFDGVGSAAPALEIYGTKGSLCLPPPSQFDGTIKQALSYDAWSELVPLRDEWDDSLWIAGIYALVDHLEGFDTPWPDAEFALHCLEAMVKIEASTNLGETLHLETSCQRPQPLTQETIRRWKHPDQRAA